jgi:hypothetical protein
MRRREKDVAADVADGVEMRPDLNIMIIVTVTKGTRLVVEKVSYAIVVC